MAAPTYDGGHISHRYRAQVYSVAGSAKATEGELGSTSVSTSGSVTQLHHLDEFGEHLKELLNKQQQDLMGETCVGEVHIKYT